MNSAENDNTKSLLPVPSEALDVHRNIISRLIDLEHLTCSSCLDPAFQDAFLEILKLYQNYQNIIVKNSSRSISCKVGCSHCCYHWVEDVNSFEAEIIADYIKKNMTERIASIINDCTSDQNELERLYEIVAGRLNECNKEDLSVLDEIDILLSVFYQMKRPCPLLDSSGCCLVYPVRPLTCRIYLSFSDPSHCSPEYINDDEISTYLLNLEENASEILDRLHYRFQKYENDTGLRSLLIKYLS